MLCTKDSNALLPVTKLLKKSFIFSVIISLLFLRCHTLEVEEQDTLVCIGLTEGQL